MSFRSRLRMVWSPAAGRVFPTSVGRRHHLLFPPDVCRTNRTLSSSSASLSFGRHQVDDLPVLSDLPKLRFPSLRHYLRGLFFQYVIIKPYFDLEFSKRNFINGAAKAVEVVSEALSKCDFEVLRPLVESRCLDEVARRLCVATSCQREILVVHHENIYWQFLYQTGVILEEETEGSRRWVEITYVAHTHPEAGHLMETSRNTTELAKAINQRGGPIVLNYRFLREYTKGLDPTSTSWTVSSINHFYLNE